MTNGVFWDGAPCGSTRSRAARRNIPEDGILHTHRCENFKSYMRNAVFWDVMPYGFFHAMNVFVRQGRAIETALAVTGFQTHEKSGDVF
jgi:hypothetical protein